MSRQTYRIVFRIAGALAACALLSLFVFAAYLQMLRPLGPDPAHGFVVAQKLFGLVYVSETESAALGWLFYAMLASILLAGALKHSQKD